MKRSTSAILTTHTGSLPRPDDLVAMVEGHDQRELRADPRFERRVETAVGEVVRKQVEAGITVVNDGEMSKVGYSTYVTERLTGFADQNGPVRPNVEARDFPEFYQSRQTAVATIRRPACVGPIEWRGDAQVKADIANLERALAGVDAADAFMTAASPGVVWHFLENEHYPSQEAYVFAVADAMRHEYRAIHEAGFVLQLDCPDLAMGWNRYDFADRTVGAFREHVELHVAALNRATEGIPASGVRLHLCWGNFEGPHVRDIPLDQILDLVLKANADAFSFEGANPRHEHEWRVFERIKLPEGKLIIPGVLDSTTNFVEHPELVAERIVRYARLVGRENVIAGSDCGFSTFARAQLTVHPTVTWAKFRAMAEGARLATEQLWR
ncbi:MAG TPA: cobalamin-independent methionine synthase II family protein [Chloroflexota bacterium]|jgi:5-methyltetrahydropteroyltriglutamate--homocysteine methyltransferase